MTISIGDLSIGPVQLTTSAATVASAVPSGNRWQVTSIIVCNITSGPVTFTMSIGADASGTRIFSDHVIAANDTMCFDGKIGLSAGQYFQAKSNTATAVNLYIGGSEITN